MTTTTTTGDATAVPTEYPYKHLIKALKAKIKVDAVDIRAQKITTREAQRTLQNGAVAQSSLAYVRGMNRARQLIYGLLRGKTWAQMENNHPDGCADDYRTKYLMKRAWVEATGSLETKVIVPDSLKEYVTL